MCGKPAVNTSVLSEDDNNEDMQENGSVTSSSSSSSNGKVVSDKVDKRSNESPEEKRRRRKLERKKRVLWKRQAKGELLATKAVPKKVINLFNRIWDEESVFVNQVMQSLPEVRQPGLLIDDDERTEEYVSIMKTGKGVQDEERDKEKAREKIRRNLKREGVELIGERAKSYQELKERLQQKLAGKVQTPNVEKREKKLKKKLKRAAEAKEKSNKGKKLISQTASSAGGGGGAKTDDSSSEVKSETPDKTPLKKKPVVKSNGEIVYSKFDFISKEGRSTGINGISSSLSGQNKKGAKGNAKPSAEELLKKAQKHEKKISNLATQGKQSEAVDLAVSQKWDTALKRADGVKVRDDAYLLKKTIKKQEKLKQLTKKKWKERVDRVEKLKEQRQQKRQTNIQTRKDDKKKRVKKLMRKRGRIA